MGIKEGEKGEKAKREKGKKCQDLFPFMFRGIIRACI
jgi:hypothetical protein